MTKGKPKDKKKSPKETYSMEMKEHKGKKGKDKKD